ncbi:hypothetical protein VKA52_18490 [Halobacillus sp. HZG1]|nr:hypothetical protein [Halobacillus sp. HZG1]MEC3885715.1 hypothetical protein [Halobacillus sp. HZG1]
MKDNPFHYDGRSLVNHEGTTDEAFVMTDETRMNIAGNPYLHEVTEEQD